MSDIFISYSRVDKAWVSILAQAFEQCGYSVWWDPEILAGQDFEKTINQALHEASCVVVVWSKTSIQSMWVRDESGVAAQRKVLLPILYEAVDPPLSFRSYHTENLQEWKGELLDPQFRRLLRAIAYKCQKDPTSSMNQTANNRSLTAPKTKLFLGLGLIGIITIGFGVIGQQWNLKHPISPPIVPNSENSSSTDTNTPSVTADSSSKITNNQSSASSTTDNESKLTCSTATVDKNQNDLVAGVDAWNSRNFTEALIKLRPFAEQGNASAQYNLAWMYEQGEGVDQSDKEAFMWYKLAAEQGLLCAQSHLANMYYHGKGVSESETEAAKWYRLAAEQGDSDAQLWIGWLYETGRGVEQSNEEALDWYVKAAEQDNSSAIEALERLTK